MAPVCAESATSHVNLGLTSPWERTVVPPTDPSIRLPILGPSSRSRQRPESPPGASTEIDPLRVVALVMAPPVYG